jgi:hypothetical protein
MSSDDDGVALAQQFANPGLLKFAFSWGDGRAHASPSLGDAARACRHVRLLKFDDLGVRHISEKKVGER